jgi:pyruvate/2-oxoglutarate dehydrogenase complex dihydrolipoamide dehydrogenase (E3) component
MEAARISAEKGHTVTLFEKTGELGGGQLRLAATPPGKDEFMNVATYYKGQFELLKNVNVVLNKEATVDDIKKELPDAVILATGGEPLKAAIPGMDGKNVVTLNDVLSGKAKVSGKVVIAGGGSAGIDCAHFLAAQELDVTVVEMLNEVAMDEELITKLTLLFMLGQKKNLKLMTGHTIQKVTKDGVVAKNGEGKDITIPADWVVAALGVTSCNPLEKSVREAVDECYVVGDAGQVGKIMEAVSGGFFAAQKI